MYVYIWMSQECWCIRHYMVHVVHCRGRYRPNMAEVNPDLLKERRTATFNVELMTNLIDGGETYTERRRSIHAKALADKEFTGGPDTRFMSREEHFEDTMRRAVHMNTMMKEMELTDPRDRQALAMIALPWESPPDSLHGGMFLPTLENQSTDEQKKKWLQKAYDREYLGTYAQTEMGHGTFLRGLETTATYDRNTEEFVINSPSVSAAKWWPGGLGKTSNCAVVMAQVYSNGVHHGMYPFFVQLRDLASHEPLRGITVGDIGPKMGFNTIDNGYLFLDHVRVPRDHMLMKHAEILPDGTFRLKTKHKKPTYSTMTMIRTFIVHNHGYRALSAAATIAIRYSAVRRQSELKPGDPEPQIMDYQTQQYKLYPYLAMSYGFWAVSHQLIELYLQGMAAQQSGDDTLMPELHALSSGLKAYSTYHACQGIEQCRFSCGGHGFSLASGLPKLYSLNVPAITFEGENTVLQLQTARYLVKSFHQAQNGQSLPDSSAYLASTVNVKCTIDHHFDLGTIISAFEHRSRRITQDAYVSKTSLEAQGRKEYDARNLSGVLMIRASNAHCELFIVKALCNTIQNSSDGAVSKVLTELCQLLAAYLITNNSGDFLEDGYMNREQLMIVRNKEIDLLQTIRPNAVALVDAFDYPDHYLGSILGRYDGNVYENLYKWAQQSPLNKTQVHSSYHKYLKPMIKAKM